jgi:predicted metalloprotease with PDZ domain
LRRHLFVVCIGALLGCAETPTPAPPVSASPAPVAASRRDDAVRRLDVTIAPRQDGGRYIDRLDVELRYAGPLPRDAEGHLALQFDDDHEGERGWSNAIADLRATDADGDLALARHEPAKDETVVTWRSVRAPSGPVRLTYTVAVKRPVGSAYYGMRAFEGGFEGTGSLILLLPAKDAAVYRTHVAWSLDHLPRGSVATSSFGRGAADVTASLAIVDNGVFMAGALGLASIEEGDAKLYGAWLGELAFDPGEATAYAAHARRAMRTFFHETEATPFTMFFAGAPNAAAGWEGSGRSRGFLLVAGGERAWDQRFKFAVTHELVHFWIGGDRTGLRLEDPLGQAYWFTEGFTVHFTREIALRAGLCTAEEFAEDLRQRVEGIVANPYRNASNAEIAKNLWTRWEFSKLAYNRGSLYAAEANAAIIKRSGGKRSLDDLILKMTDDARALARDRAAKAGPDADSPLSAKLPAEAFKDLITAELGAEGRARYEAVIERGDLPNPPPDAFGPCFKQVDERVPRFDLGFSDASFGAHKIVGLVKGGPAERAGLREGDVTAGGRMVVYPGNTSKKASVEVMRDGKLVTFEYWPHGKTVDAHVWVYDPKVPRDRCPRSKL